MHTERALSCCTSNRLMLSNLTCSISRPWDYTTVLRLHDIQTWSHRREDWKDAFKCTECRTFSKNLNPRNIVKSVSDILIHFRFLFENSFWISISGCKLTILPDIQPANRIVIISIAFVWKGVGFSILKNIRTRTRIGIQKFWNSSGVGVWKSEKHLNRIDIWKLDYRDEHWTELGFDWNRTIRLRILLIFHCFRTAKCFKN